ncbi:MAG TPA: hypothetical protein VMV14_08815 [Acidimicrobiales bacterium]|nr:hypothetical protein [Acidimicrobiales bacterium]
MGGIGLRLERSDEYMHELGPEPNFNESMYFNAIDPDKRIGAFFRLGNRANEGTGEMTVCLYLPDGRVGFMFQRPSVTDNLAFDAAGLRFEVLEPFAALRVSYTGALLVLDDPAELADPKAAFGANPTAQCHVEMAFAGRSAMFGGEPDRPSETPGEEFARGHYEQLVEATGRIAVGEEEWDVHGFGLRDHSWGPRYWQAPWYYRWLTANFGPDFGFMGSRIARRQGPGIRSGFVWDGETLHLCDDFQVRSTFDGPERTHRSLEAELVCGDRRWAVKGTVLRLVPLRNRRRDSDGLELVTRISEGMTRWQLDDGRIGYGLSEYLDQIVDGVPVGLAE